MWSSNDTPLALRLRARGLGAVALRGLVSDPETAAPRTDRARAAAREGGSTTSDATQQGQRDERLVSATLAGDRQAFGRLVELHQRRLFALVFRYAGNEADAADLTQRAFLKAFENLHKLERRQAFVSWLCRIATNLAKNEIRFYATKAFVPVDDSGLTSEQDLEAQMQYQARRAAMRRALAELPDKQRQCILLRIDAELPFREIGEAVGCSEASARVNYHHGLRALQRALTDETAP